VDLIIKDTIIDGLILIIVSDCECQEHARVQSIISWTTYASSLGDRLSLYSSYKL